MKRILTVLAAMLVCTASFAQFGIVGGLTSSSPDLGGAVSELTTKSMHQYNAGIAWKFRLGKILAIQPELVYDVKGAKISDFQSLGDLDCTTGFVELPVLFQVGYEFGDLARVYGIAAPFIGYAVNNNVKLAGTTVDETWDNVKNRFEWGAELGFGCEVFKHVQLNLTYFWNFGNLYDTTWTWEGVAAAASSAKCGGIKFGAAILF